MTQAFVPLVPGALTTAQSAGPVRLKPITPASPQFQQTPSTPKPEANGSATMHPTHGEPKITLERQGDTITHIRIQCGCGQVIELNCQY